MEWFSEWFNEDYEKLYAHRNKDEARLMVDLYESKIERLTHANVLDMCCGLGRVSYELAKRSERVHAFDLSPYFIEKCKQHNFYNNLTFEERDIRDMSFQSEFDTIFHIFTSFGYFETLEENLLVFQSVYNALKENGYYFFDFLNETYVKEHLVPETITKADGVTYIQKRRIEADRVIKDISIKRGETEKVYTESVQLISKSVFEDTFRKIGFHVVSCYGHYDGTPFDQNQSNRLIYILRK